MPGFNPQRLRVARERSGLFRKELAAACRVTPQTVSNWESGLSEPTEDASTVISAETGFPTSFFSLGEIEPLAEGAVTFRARSRIPARQKYSALAAGVLAKELARWIESRFDLPPVRLPNLEGQAPDLVAELVRAEWMLGSKPIPNMIRLLESRGVLVFSLAQDVHELDAFSFWTGDRPIVLLNTIKSAERSRTDAAHELFHLLCHREETGKKEEEDATRFASALLLPKDDVYQHIPSVGSLQQLILAKRRWGVALSSLVYRLHVLGVITDWQYRMFFIELSKRGHRTQEPSPIQEREQSTVLAQVFSSLADQGIKARDLARELGWERRQLDELVFGLGVLVPVQGGGGSGQPSDRAQLRLMGSEHTRDSDLDD